MVPRDGKRFFKKPQVYEQFAFRENDSFSVVVTRNFFNVHRENYMNKLKLEQKLLAAHFYGVKIPLVMMSEKEREKGSLSQTHSLKSRLML